MFSIWFASIAVLELVVTPGSPIPENTSITITCSLKDVRYKTGDEVPVLEWNGDTYSANGKNVSSKKYNYVITRSDVISRADDGKDIVCRRKKKTGRKRLETLTIRGKKGYI